MNNLPVDSDEAWELWRRQWRLRSDTIYLNHGSFGPSPEPVRQAQQAWKERMDEQPMDFFTRLLPVAWRNARARLAELVGTSDKNLVFVDNATQGMNIVANSVKLGRGDEVLVTDHDYGAVHRIWHRSAEATGAVCRTVELPLPFESAGQACDAIIGQITDATRLVVVSHITSPTAVTLPIQQICRQAQLRRVPVCVDGPHAVAQLDLAIDSLACSFYTASCHKWLSAPFGSGFLYVAPELQATIITPQLSWGTLPPSKPERWDDEFQWVGTRDPSPYLTVPVAINFLASVGWDAFRERTHWLARYARQAIAEIVNQPPLTPDSPEWYGSMAHVPLPPGDSRELQLQIWRQFGIEVPIVNWKERRWIRVSCHLYNRKSEIDTLVGALRKLL